MVVFPAALIPERSADASMASRELVEHPATVDLKLDDFGVLKQKWSFGPRFRFITPGKDASTPIFSALDVK